MKEWLKKNWTAILIGVTTVLLMMFYIGCQARTQSLSDPKRLVSRGELQIELNNVLATAELRMADLDKQEAIRSLILQNALVLASGGTLNPVGIISAIAAVYGLATAGQKVVSTFSNGIKKNSGTV
jgi:hypothetical protein